MRSGREVGIVQLPARALATVSAMEPALLEREAVLDSVCHLLGRLRGGHGSALFVIGEPGLGKTAILDRARRLADPDVRVARCRGVQMETSLPFGLIEQLIESRGAGEQGLLSRPRPGMTPDDVRATRFYRVTRWLAETPGPLLLAIDDLHWGDPDSIALISYLCRRLDPLPVAVIATLRPFPRAAIEMVKAQAYAEDATLEQLRPLSSDAARQVINARLGREPDDAMVRRATGNPLLLEHLCTTTARGHGDRSEPLPRRVVALGELLLASFAGLCEPGWRCAQAASVLGDRFIPAIALEVAELEGREAECAESALWQSGLVREVSGRTVEFVHPVFREALVEELGEPLRRRLRERALPILVELGRPWEAAEQALLGEMVGNPDAVAALRTTGAEALQMGSFEIAVKHLGAAVRFAGRRACSDLLMLLGDALVADEQLHTAIDVFGRLLRDHPGAPAMTRCRALHALAWTNSAIGSFEESSRCMHEATMLGLTVDRGAAIELSLEHAARVWRTEGPGAALPRLETARDLARESRCPGRWWRANLEWSLCTLQCGDPSGLAVSRSAAERLLALEVPALVAAQGWSGVLLTHVQMTSLLEEFEESERIVRVVFNAAHRTVAPLVIAQAAALHARALRRRGRLDEALALLERTLELPELTPHLTISLNVRMALTLHALGRTEESEEWCQRIESMPLAGDQWWVQMSLLRTRGERHLQRGDATQARGLFARVREISDGAGIGEPCAVPWQRHGIAAELGCGNREVAETIVASLESGAERLPCRWPRIAAATGRALLADTAGDTSTAEHHFQIALDQHREVELPIEEAETLMTYGRFLRRRGEVVRSRQVLGDAVRLAERHSAMWVAGLAHDELGVARGRRRRRRAEPDRLTPQERRVADLVASGLTNREVAGQLFVAQGTVEVHLARVFSKLGISSRRQLRAGKGEFLGSG